jgi:hypothetical protein
MVSREGGFVTFTNFMPGAATAKIVIYGLLIGAIFSAGWYVEAKRADHQIDALKIQASQLQAQQATLAARALSKAVSDATAQTQRDDAAALASAEAQQKIVVKYQTITKEVHDAQIPTACSHLGNDWMRIANESIAGLHASPAKAAAKP